MCLRMLEPKIETNRADLTVYKVLDTENRSPFFDFAYSPNTLFRLRAPLTGIYSFSGRCYLIHRGFHAYRTLKIARYWAGVEAERGYKSYKVVEMVIPKGAKVAYGTEQEIVSTSIRVGLL